MRGIFSPVCTLHGPILMKLITITDYQIHMMTFSRSWAGSVVKVTDFSQNAAFWHSHTD